MNTKMLNKCQMIFIDTTKNKISQSSPHFDNSEAGVNWQENDIEMYNFPFIKQN